MRAPGWTVLCCGCLLLAGPARGQAGDLDARIPVRELLADFPDGQQVSVGVVVRVAPPGYPEGAQQDIGAATTRALEHDPRVASVVMPSDLGASDLELAQEAASHGVGLLVVLRFVMDGPRVDFTSLDGRGVELRQVSRTLAQLAGNPTPVARQEPPPRRVAPEEPVEDAGPRWRTDAALFGGGLAGSLGMLAAGSGLCAGGVGLAVLGGQLPRGSQASLVLTYVAAALYCGGFFTCLGSWIPCAAGTCAVGLRRGRGISVSLPAPSSMLPTIGPIQTESTEEERQEEPQRSDDARSARPPPAFGRSTPNPEHRSPPPSDHGSGGGASQNRHGSDGGSNSHGSTTPPPRKKKPDEEKEKDKEREKARFKR